MSNQTVFSVQVDDSSFTLYSSLEKAIKEEINYFLENHLPKTLTLTGFSLEVKRLDDSVTIKFYGEGRLIYDVHILETEVK